MTIQVNTLIREILKIGKTETPVCELKSDNQEPQNEGSEQKKKQTKKSIKVTKIHYCDLTGVPLN